MAKKIKTAIIGTLIFIGLSMRLIQMLGGTVQTVFQAQSAKNAGTTTFSPHSSERLQPVQHLVIHSFSRPVPAMLQRLNKLKVSTHYLIDTAGKVTQLVPENRIAWHAGASSWRGSKGLNATSIGIELQNSTLGQTSFSKPQIDTFRLLAKDLIYRYHIDPKNIVAHSDIAPTRKVDVGKTFPWQRLAREGIGLWPEKTGEDICSNKVDRCLSEIGYDTTDEDKALLAFERHFMPEIVPIDKDIRHMEENLANIKPVRNSTVYQRLSDVVRLYR